MDETTQAPAETGVGWTDALTLHLWGFNVGAALLAVALMALAVAARPWIGDVLRFGLARLAQRTKSTLDDEIVEAVTEPVGWVPVAIAAFFAIELLGLTGTAHFVAESLTQTLLAFALFWALRRLIPVFANALRGSDSTVARPVLDWGQRAAALMIWLAGAATILELWEIRVLPVIAGFGLVGVAVALGAQDLFKNLISGMLILSERRFCVGDWIKVDGVVEGTVEEINFRSTKVRRFDRAPVYVPNAAFANDAVVNFGEMTHRRISWMIGLEYRASAAQLQAIRDRVEDAILSDDRFIGPDAAPCFVRLDAFSDSSVDLMIYIFTQTRDWGEWLAIKEELLLTIKRIVEEEGAGFAFPSQSVYLEPGGAFERPFQVAVEGAQAPPAEAAAAKAPARKAAAKPAAKAPAKTQLKTAPSKTSPKAPAKTDAAKEPAARAQPAKTAEAKPAAAKPAAAKPGPAAKGARRKAAEKPAPAAEPDQEGDPGRRANGAQAPRDAERSEPTAAH